MSITGGERPALKDHCRSAHDAALRSRARSLGAGAVPWQSAAGCNEQLQVFEQLPFACVYRPASCSLLSVEPMTRTQKTVFILVALVALVLGLTINKVLSRKGQQAAAAFIDAGIILLPQSRPLPTLSMINQDGQPVRIDELKDKWSLLFLGYTFCPDICATTLAELRQIKRHVPT